MTAFYLYVHTYTCIFGCCRATKLRLLNFLSLFRDLQEPTRFSGGGGVGVVADFFRDLQEPTRFSGGGGVVA